MHLTRPCILLLSAFAVFVPSLAAHAQAYTSIVVFGDSLSDTGNDAALSLAKYGVPLPSPYAVPILGPTSDYTYGRFTDGPDSTPATTKYQGVWVEQLAAMLPEKPSVTNSLAGGKDYAYGDALAANGYTVASFGPYSITLDNVGLQISNYLATHPKIDSKTLFVVWAGANDVIDATSIEDVPQAAINQVIDVQRLVDAGASQIIVPNLPALGKTPQLLGTSAAATANKATVLFNDTLSASLDVLEIANFFRRRTIFRLDVYSLFSQVIASPAAFGLSDVTTPAQEQPVDPNTYLFWDTLHPTTKGHNILANAAVCKIHPSRKECPPGRAL